MKYVVMSVRLGELNIELPFVFPEVCVHSTMAFGFDRALRQQYRGALVRPVSAGFISSTAIEEGCHGDSETLQLKSRGEVDDKLINMMDYGSIHVHN